MANNNLKNKITLFLEKIHLPLKNKSYSLNSWYFRAFEVANFESVVRFSKFKKVDPIWWIEISKNLPFL